MKRILSFLFLILLLLLIFGCVSQELPPTDHDEQAIDDQISDIGSIDEDLNLSELDEIDNMLDELDQI